MDQTYKLTAVELMGNQGKFCIGLEVQQPEEHAGKRLHSVATTTGSLNVWVAFTNGQEIPFPAGTKFAFIPPKQPV